MQERLATALVAALLGGARGRDPFPTFGRLSLVEAFRAGHIDRSVSDRNIIRTWNRIDLGSSQRALLSFRVRGAVPARIGARLQD
jgi:hypothetical protein